MNDAGMGCETDEETKSIRRDRERLGIPHLFLVLECGRPWAGGARHDLASIDEIRIGRGTKRSASRSIVGDERILDLSVPDTRMSHRHARIARSSDGFSFEDLGSTNGSRVGRESVVAPVVLNDGDVLEVGRTFFRFRAALATPVDTLADVDSDGSSGVAQGFRTLLPALAGEHVALAKVAASRVPMLLLGETGTGKEVLARAIHQSSGRRGPFVAVNCGAIPPTLAEAQLFGHIRGAFSGATRDEPGFVRSAHLGTLFLDEVGDLLVPTQAALLRVLQESEVVPIGSARPEPVDLRVLCATHRDLQDSVARGAFRVDLLARLAGLRHKLPPLRERIEDLGLLVAAILSRIASDRGHARTFTREAARRLLEYEWPLNVRELELGLSVAAVLAGDDPIDVEHLAASGPGVAARNERRDHHHDDAMRDRLVDELRRARGNVAAVARSLGKARMQVQRWMKRFNIDPKTYRAP